VTVAPEASPGTTQLDGTLPPAPLLLAVVVEAVLDAALVVAPPPVPPVGSPPLPPLRAAVPASMTVVLQAVSGRSEQGIKTRKEESFM
jgi:hypothetical protein